jgi:hypothetical protein
MASLTLQCPLELAVPRLQPGKQHPPGAAGPVVCLCHAALFRRHHCARSSFVVTHTSANAGLCLAAVADSTSGPPTQMATRRSSGLDLLMRVTFAAC